MRLDRQEERRAPVRPGHESQLGRRRLEGREGESSDSDLVNMLRKGEASAVQAIMKRYHEKLFSLANRICNNPADAEEVLQDVYMIVMNKIDQFEERSTLSTWLYRVTVNASLMKLRSQRGSRHTISMESLSVPLGDEENSLRSREETRSPDDMLMTKELFEQIKHSVESLPEIYQDVFFLRDVKGFSIKETSRMLRTTPAAVKSRLHRSRFFLQERLKPYMYDN